MDIYDLNTADDTVEAITNFTDYSRAQIVLNVDYKNVQKAPDQTLVAPIRVFSWDIECQSSQEGEFPNSKNKDDYIKRVEPSSLSGNKMAKKLSEIILNLE